MQTWGAPKSYERREVPVPRFLADLLAAHVVGKSDDLVFSGNRTGEALRVLVFRRAAFNAAATAIGFEGLRPHDLRHTAASLAIASGASIKVVQAMLGHASATVTLDRMGICTATSSTTWRRGCTRQPRRPAKLPRTPCGLKAINQSANLG